MRSFVVGMFYVLGMLALWALWDVISALHAIAGHLHNIQYIIKDWRVR